MKKHVYILGALYTLICGLSLALALTLFLVLQADSRNEASLRLISPLFLLGNGVVLLAGLIGGIGLLYFRPWARALLLFPSVLFLFLMPIGTALGVYGLWVLRNAETAALIAGAGFEAPEAGSPLVPPRVPFPRSPALDLLGVMACVAAGFFLVIRTGFVLHAEPLSAPFDSTALTGSAVVVLVAGFAAATVAAVQYGGRARTAARIRRDANDLNAAYREARRLRVAELAADPARARYAPLVERGEEWTEDDIVYDENQESVLTCVHLQSVERAMRRAGIRLRRAARGEVLAKCRVDAVALQHSFAILAPPVRYAEFFQPERHEHDNPAAHLICDEHLSMIHLVHPEEAYAENAAVFPETRPAPPGPASSI